MQVKPSAEGIYTIQWLSSETGVSVDQITRWRKRGVVSPAVSGSSPLRWNATHLHEILTTRDILDANMSLADIRDRLHPPTDEADLDMDGLFDVE